MGGFRSWGSQNKFLLNVFPEREQRGPHGHRKWARNKNGLEDRAKQIPPQFLML